MGSRLMRTSSSSSRGNSPFHPTADTTTFKDLLLFEERLKMNAQMLKRRKKRYEAFLAGLVGFIVLLAHRLIFEPPIYTLLRYLAQGTLAVALVTLVLFFASGMYQERIRYANRYVPHANKSLRTMNMHLNMRRPTVFSLPSRFRSTTPTPPPPPIKRPSSAPSIIPPIPPTNNPRGELIFSNRVDKAFKDGYERYRAAFERRREERLKELQGGKVWGWAWFGKGKPVGGSGKMGSAPGMTRRETPPIPSSPTRRGRTPSPSSRASSPTRRSNLGPGQSEDSANDKTPSVIPSHVFDSQIQAKGNRERAESYSFVFSGTERLRQASL